MSSWKINWGKELLEKIPGISSDLPNWAEALTAILATTTLAAIIFAGIQIAFVRQQMHREFEMQYLLRFWQITDRFSDTYKQLQILTNHDRAVILEYLNLSEDQIELRALKRVTNGTWKFWRRDIRTYCQSQHVRGVLELEPTDRYPELRKLIADPNYDPLSKVWKINNWRKSSHEPSEIEQ